MIESLTARPEWLIVGAVAMRAAPRHGDGPLGVARDLHGREG